ncbi:MAG: hydroxypyruvate isomerase family protein [Devosia sp.]
MQRIEAAGRAGFKAIELHWPYDVPAEEIAAACRAAGVTLLGLNTRVGNAGEFGLGALPGREADFAAAFAQSLDYCRVTGATAIHAMAGVVPDTPQSATTLVANLKVASRKASEQGVMILLEAINPRDKPGYFYHRVERAAEIIGDVGAPNVKLMYDAYHVGVAQGDIIRRLEALKPLIGHIQIAAVPSRAEPDEGEINYPAIFDAIEAVGYDGWVGCEYKPRGDTDAGLVWRETFGRTRFS